MEAIKMTTHTENCGRSSKEISFKIVMPENDLHFIASAVRQYIETDNFDSANQAHKANIFRIYNSLVKATEL